MKHDTSIMVEAIADMCLDHEFPDATPDQKEWFRDHAARRANFTYANSVEWRRELSKPDPRDFLHIYVTHWAKAFALNPTVFKRRYNKTTKKR
jgi:hypothetical protein